MVLQLTFNEFLRLQGAKGAAIEVLDGKVWITEDGRQGDRFLEAGRSYRVAGEGLVVVGADHREKGGTHFARVEVRKPTPSLHSLLGKLLREWRAERTRRELRELSDHALRDIGLRRDEIGERF
jgi:uncharacterized protein YjiS (DUF1127 family)